MTITQLRCFIAMAEELSFTGVARRLYISQAAVSYHIRALEEELDGTLFARTTRKVSLTEVGKQFYREVSQAVSTIDSACDEIRRSNKQKSFSIGYSTLCYGERFRTIVKEFTDERPDLGVFLNNVEPEDNLFDLLLEDRIDVALFLNPFRSLPKGVASYDCGEVRHLLLVPTSHPLAACESIDCDDLPQREILAHEGMKRIEGMEGSIFTHAGEAGQAGPTTPKNLESLLSMIRSGLCLARLPAVDQIEHAGIHCVTVTGSKADLGAGPKLTIAWNKNRISPQVGQFCSIAKEILSAK